MEAINQLKSILDKYSIKYTTDIKEGKERLDIVTDEPQSLLVEELSNFCKERENDLTWCGSLAPTDSGTRASMSVTAK